ncbi:unnamed protein product [Durusdinium trenchii]|uniref:Uncharacterized protein n=1 Tax=Durusdinium trenchii TaxID=1381693 RepID=A0ABP0T048_9DINO
MASRAKMLYLLVTCAAIAFFIVRGANVAPWGVAVSVFSMESTKIPSPWNSSNSSVGIVRTSELSTAPPRTTRTSPEAFALKPSFEAFEAFALPSTSSGGATSTSSTFPPSTSSAPSPEKRLLVMHIIEQLGGATKSLVQFLFLAQRLGRRPVLPGIADGNVTDSTVYRSFNSSNVKDLDYFLDFSKVSDPDWLPPIGFREHLVETGPILDAVLIFVLNPIKRPKFLKIIEESIVMNCSWIWNMCQRKPTECGGEFMWHIDLRGIGTWQLAENAPVLCVHHNFSYWNYSLSDWLQTSNVTSFRNIAVLNWLGVTSWPCAKILRICSSVLDTRGEEGERPEEQVLNLTRFLNRLRLASEMERMADHFLISHPALQNYSYSAVQMRSERILYEGLLSAKCNDSGVFQWFSELSNTTSSWSSAWFRARDMKLGGSTTLRREVALQLYDNQSVETLQKLERAVWQKSPAQFLDHDCERSGPVTCFLVDVALLSHADRLFLWGNSVGVPMFCRIQRKHLGKSEDSMVQSRVMPRGC